MKKSAFSLVELLIALSLIALVSAFIIPRFLEVRQGALIRVCEDQTEAFNTALQAWSIAQGSIAQASANFGNGQLMKDDFFMDADNSCASCSKVIDFMDPDFLQKEDLQNHAPAGLTVAYSTVTMRSIPGTRFNSQKIGATIISAAPGVNHAHFRVIWLPSGAGADRTRTNPVTILFVPIS